MSKVAIITGASSGIGHATALELAQRGFPVMLAARREERLKELQQEIEAIGGKVSYRVVDVTSYAEMEALAKATVDEFGRVDILVNNAGVMPISFLNKRKIDEWDQMIDVNIKGVLYGIGAVLPYMEAQKSGHIINISSVAGHIVGPGSSVYSGTKYAVRAITEGLRQEMKFGQNVRTTIICPGAVETELTNTITDKDLDRIREQFKNMKVLEGKNIADAIAYAIEQPEHVDVNEIIVRPTAQSM
ncbi:SDR family oxidoreductase [Marininema halotolerans]|uniref:NADP-dependent 3-hydroxy acid dehydrogenase YdfG n=1 Tax=Marininema halotolerans TaxID=1155944 RepID=A0A1I6P3F8_9BACL|nr:SDR family oxidoreductase [Marininema halotolerans]SFS34727.1 NADP-dependent 3-hydroxy acid dehydrogenase YdfG [Marininema halotolerans]